MTQGWTAKGAATRARIVDTAAALLYERGIDDVGINDIREASSTSHGQVFHYFPDGRAELLRAVVDRQARQALDDQRPALDTLDTWESWLAWKEQLIAVHTARGGAGGCPLGSLTSQLSEGDAEARRHIDAGFRTWIEHFASGLRSMQASGTLREDVNPEALAETMLATVQGGFTLMQASRSVSRLAHALDGALRLLASAMPRHQEQ